jgi:recombination endonuclease VII
MTDSTASETASTQKRCTKCGELKDLSEFHRDRKARDGLRPDCKTCVNKKSAEYYAENREDYRVKRAAYRDANREQIQVSGRVYSRKSRTRFAPGGYRHRMLKEEWDRRWKEQNGKCYLCGDDLDDADKIGTDHDHRCCGPDKSCEVCRRGIACIECNSLIGLAKDDPDRLRRAADALEFAQAGVDARAREREKAVADRPVSSVSWDHVYGQLTLFPVVRGKVVSFYRGSQNYTPEERRVANSEGVRRYRERERQELKDQGLYNPPNGEKTHCPAGHIYDEENTYWFNGSRRCKICANEGMKAYAKENADKIRAYRSTPEYRERANARSRELRQLDGDRIRERDRARYQANPEPKLEARRRYLARKQNEQQADEDVS